MWPRRTRSSKAEGMMMYLQVQEFDYPLAEPAALEWGCYIDSVLSRDNATCTQEELEGHTQQTCT